MRLHTRHRHGNQDGGKSAKHYPNTIWCNVYRTPLFVSENQYDEEQIFAELKVPFPSAKDPAGIAKLIP